MAFRLDHHDGVQRINPLAKSILALSMVGCAAPGTDAIQRLKDQGVPPSHIVALDGAAIGTRVSGTELDVVFVDRDADGKLQSHALAGAMIVPGTNSYFAVSGSGVDLSWNTFLYGSAAPGVTTVTSTLPDARGGQVVDGVWVIASPEEGVSIGQIEVTFLDAQGGVVEQQ